MLLGFNLNHLFVFPFQDNEARKQFLIGCLIYLAGFFIPILPWLIVTGYNAILVRQILRGEAPHLVPWDNWEALLKDGARLFGIRLVYSIPLLILILPLVLIFFVVPFFPILVQHGGSRSIGIVSFSIVLISTGISLLIMPLSLVIGLMVPAAEVHVIARDDFMAGLQIRDWWPIFKKNWGGFVVALAIVYGLMMIMSFGIQMMFITLVLLCLLPIFIPAVSMYYSVIQYVAFAQAYKDGNDRLGMEAVAA
jgi:uncharacterized protein DUF4013